jgi:hypothetical protein
MRILFLITAIFTIASCSSSPNKNTKQETDNIVIIDYTTTDSVFDVSTIENIGELLDTLESITSDTITE